MRIANRDSKHFVARREIFKANNIFSENYNDRFYVVYSYGYHFPLWVYDRKELQWYGNSDRYSVTTSKHKSQSRPEVYSQDFIFRDTETLKYFFQNAEREAKAVTNEK